MSNVSVVLITLNLFTVCTALVYNSFFKQNNYLLTSRKHYTWLKRYAILISFTAVHDASTKKHLVGMSVNSLFLEVIYKMNNVL